MNKIVKSLIAIFVLLIVAAFIVGYMKISKNNAEPVNNEIIKNASVKEVYEVVKNSSKEYMPAFKVELSSSNSDDLAKTKFIVYHYGKEISEDIVNKYCVDEKCFNKFDKDVIIAILPYSETVEYVQKNFNFTPEKKSNEDVGLYYDDTNDVYVVYFNVLVGVTLDGEVVELVDYREENNKYYVYEYHLPVMPCEDDNGYCIKDTTTYLADTFENIKLTEALYSNATIYEYEFIIDNNKTYLSNINEKLS